MNDQNFGITITPCANGYTVQLPVNDISKEFAKKMTALGDGLMKSFREQSEGVDFNKESEQVFKELIESAGDVIEKNQKLFVFSTLQEALDFIKDRID